MCHLTARPEPILKTIGIVLRACDGVYPANPRMEAGGFAKLKAAGPGLGSVSGRGRESLSDARSIGGASQAGLATARG
jgi:hypothetical protein